ncbi:MAG: hydroxymethylpyrimidine/phosphomethylpyrimidine kinase [Muribaculaceae bacterium]|nr:hydroxymethylpyrimidine/phosphomethylpyrimidine kinase [Muribaculaceae bacterium]
MVRIVSIGGSDSIGGAGIQADVRTASLLHAYCATAVTCVTVQNSAGIISLNPLATDLVIAQLDAIFSDFIPDAIKVGLLPNSDMIAALHRYLTPYHDTIKIVLDPILAPTKGTNIVNNNHTDFFDNMRELSSLSYVTTPNLNELPLLETFKSKYVIIKGGHGNDNERCTDKIYQNVKDGNTLKEVADLVTRRIQTLNSHGTGCVYSTALAVGLADGLDIVKSAMLAQKVVTTALDEGKDRNFGSGYGPTLWHSIVIAE